MAEYFSLYVLEGFLVRLTESRFADQLVLKGGLLMAAFSARRPTRDIDLSATGFPNAVSEAEDRVRSIARQEVDDGLQFDVASVRGEEIREEADYQGVRVHLSARLATARVPFHVDINFGDPLMPSPTTTGLPKLLGGSIDILAHPLPMVLAEKIVTAVERGSANTRWRDFVDIASLAATEEIAGDVMLHSVVTVADHRQVERAPLARVLQGMAGEVQQQWASWRRKQRLTDKTPEQFQQLVDACSAFADPVLMGNANGLHWSPTTGQWG